MLKHSVNLKTIRYLIWYDHPFEHIDTETLTYIVKTFAESELTTSMKCGNCVDGWVVYKELAIHTVCNTCHTNVIITLP